MTIKMKVSIHNCRALSEFPAIPQSEILSYNVNGIVQTKTNQLSSNNHSVIKSRAAEQNGYKRGTSSGGSSSSPLSTASSSGSTVISRWYVYIFTEQQPSNESVDLQYVFYGKEYNNVFAHSWKCNYKLHQMINVQSSQYNSQISLITHSNVPTRY